MNLFPSKLLRMNLTVKYFQVELNLLKNEIIEIVKY
jgi:hypothetical protein